MSTTPRRYRGAAFAAALTASVVCLTPAWAATPTPGATASTGSTTSVAADSSTSATSPTGSASADGSGTDTHSEQQLTPAEIAAQVSLANDLVGQITSANTQLGAAMQEMQNLSARTNAVLEKLDTAKEAEATARATEAEATRQLEVLTLRLEQAHRVLRHWAYSAYTEGQQAQVLGVLDAMASDPSEVSDPVGDLSYISDQRARAFAEVTRLTDEQKVTTQQAADARKKAAEAVATIQQSKLELDQAVAAQEKRLGELNSLQSSAAGQAGALTGTLLAAGTPAARAAAASLRDALASTPVVAFKAGKLCSQDDTVYPNGALPLSALCPLEAQPGEMLRPRAAAAFDALSKAYAKAFGSPICMTDSYRTLAEQYAVKITRGKWAATPGTSNHGLGVAVDLCGGINSFGTPQHLWMKQNAPLYGWYHPSWAAADGRLPEPWHWQFGG